MSPLLLRLVRIHGPKILKLLNKQSKGLPKLPPPKSEVLLKNFESGRGGTLLDIILSKRLPSSVLFGRIRKPAVKKAITTVKSYPNLFRSLDPKTNIVNANEINKALKVYNPHKVWSRGLDRMKTTLPKKMSPMNPRKFKRVMEID